MIKKAWFRSCFFWMLLANILLTGANVLLLVHLAPSGCPKELDFDYYGVIVGVLSILITILIGWNISSVIDIKWAKKEIERNLKKNQLSVDKSVKKATDEYAESKKQLDSLELKLNNISYENLQNVVDILSGSGLVSDDGKEAAVLRVYSRLLVIHHRLNNISDYSETLDGIYDYYKNNNNNLNLSKDEANSILAILFPIAKSEARYSKFSEIYNWLSSFLMK